MDGMKAPEILSFNRNGYPDFCDANSGSCHDWHEDLIDPLFMNAL